MKNHKLLTICAVCFMTISACSSNLDKSKISSAVSMTASQIENPLTTNGMVTSPNYLATQAGVDVLRRGGTAVDAAIAAAATLAVVYPQMCTLGGDNFRLIYNAKTGELKALNASGRSGAKATIDFYTSKGYQKIPSRGYYAANTVQE